MSLDLGLHFGTRGRRVTFWWSNLVLWQQQIVELRRSQTGAWLRLDVVEIQGAHIKVFGCKFDCLLLIGEQGHVGLNFGYKIVSLHVVILHGFLSFIVQSLLTINRHLQQLKNTIRLEPLGKPIHRILYQIKPLLHIIEADNF